MNGKSNYRNRRHAKPKGISHFKKAQARIQELNREAREGIVPDHGTQAES